LGWNLNNRKNKGNNDYEQILITQKQVGITINYGTILVFFQTSFYKLEGVNDGWIWIANSYTHAVDTLMVVGSKSSV
jgi:hypothetical protein